VGRDVSALINGALATGRGLDVSLNTPALSLKLSLTADFATLAGSITDFDISGGGVNFQLGPSINATQQVGFGVQSVAASRIGGATIEDVRYFLDSLKTGQANSLVDGRSQQAAQILDAAITDISVLRGRLGAFERNTIQTNIRSLQTGFENITASESQIRDADFAKETAALTRAQILQQAGTSVLATANVSSQSVLTLLQ
jgi:flagellin